MNLMLHDVRHGIPLPDDLVQCVVTSPPYWGLRDYGTGVDQLGMESTPSEYVANMVAAFREVKRVLRPDGTLWLNIGDSYCTKPNGPDMSSSGLQGALAAHAEYRVAHGGRGRVIPDGMKHKDMVGIPWMLAFALRADGWYLRADIIWHKSNPMPESVKDRPSKAHEYLFLLSKEDRYFYDAGAIAEPAVKGASGSTFTNGKTGVNGNGRVSTLPRQERATRNARSVWMVATQGFPEAHFATFPEALVEPCVLAGSRPGDVVLDPFSGSGTVGVVAQRHGRQFIGLDNQPEYLRMAQRRIDESRYV